MRRAMLIAYAYTEAIHTETRLAVVSYLANLYRERESLVFHRQKNDFDVYYQANLNSSKDLDPNYLSVPYRMSCETFDFVCQTVFDNMVKESHRREAIPVPKRVGVALWWLGNGGS